MEGPAAHCFGRQDIFADRRLDGRLSVTFNQLARHPEGSLPRRLPSRPMLVGGYRLFNNPKVIPSAFIQAHRQASLAKLAGRKCRVLLLHDTTVLDYSGLDVEGLGQVGNGHGKGLYAHHSLAIIPETREVAGLWNQILHQRIHVPAKGESRGQRQARASRESRLWKQAVADLPEMPEGIAVTDISDRGSDITEYLWHEITTRRQFIVRSQHNRTRVDPTGLAPLDKLHDHLRSLPAAGTYTLTVAAEKGGVRAANMTVSFARVHLAPPRQARGDHGQELMELWGVIVREMPSAQGQAPPPGEPLEWLLLTNRPVATVEEARGVAADYGCRWMIEDYHKAQKTGCGIEELQMTTRHGLDNAIAMLSVLAVHVLQLRCLARDPVTAPQPAHLHVDAKKVKLAARTLGHSDWRTLTLWDFYIAVAKLGGYMLNPKKRPPGWIILWRGYMRLEDMCQGVELWENKCVQT